MLKFKTRKIPLSEIKIPARFLKTSPAPEKISRRYEVYHKHGIFDRAIIIDQDNTLLDGYTAYLVAKMMGVEVLEVVRVTGVEYNRSQFGTEYHPAEVKLPESKPEPKQEPVRLYCVKNSNNSWVREALTKGKVYAPA